MRISDWSSDVCSSDLVRQGRTRCFLGGENGIRHQRAAEPGESHPHFGALRRIRQDACPRGGYPVPRIAAFLRREDGRSEEHTSELQSLMRISYAVFCLKKKNYKKHRIYNMLRK